MSLPALLYHMCTVQFNADALSASPKPPLLCPTFLLHTRRFDDFHLSVFLHSCLLRITTRLLCITWFRVSGRCHFAYVNQVNEFVFTAPTILRVLPLFFALASLKNLAKKKKKRQKKSESFSLLYCSVAAIIQCI